MNLLHSLMLFVSVLHLFVLILVVCFCLFLFPFISFLFFSFFGSQALNSIKNMGNALFIVCFWCSLIQAIQTMLFLGMHMNEKKKDGAILQIIQNPSFDSLYFPSLFHSTNVWLRFHTIKHAALIQWQVLVQRISMN